MATPLRSTPRRRVIRWRRTAGWERRRLAYRAPSRLRPRRSGRPLPTARKPSAHPNPIIQAELTHLARRSDQRRKPAAVLVYVAFAASIVLTAALGLMPKSGNLLTASMYDTYMTLSNALRVVDVALLALTFIAQIVLTGQALSFSSDTVAREKDGGTWELILLTGRSAGQTVLDKWWAVQIYLYRRFRGLIFARAAAFLWLGLTAARGGIYYDEPDALAPFAGAAFVLGFTFLDIALAAAAGLVPSVRFRRSVASAVTLAFFFASVFVYGAAQVILKNTFGLFRDGMLPNTVLPLMAVPVDSGTFLTIALMRPLNAEAWGEAAIGIAASLVIFAALIGGLVGLARALANRPYEHPR